ncbi:MAG: hypothetical protein K2Y37_14680 [Pirellulales bacterium]|nr:hypothetical protein [Pirellulales bacterium]
MTRPRRIGHDGTAATLLPYFDLAIGQRPAFRAWQIPEAAAGTIAAMIELRDAVTDFHARTWCDLAGGAAGQLPKD